MFARCLARPLRFRGCEQPPVCQVFPLPLPQVALRPFFAIRCPLLLPHAHNLAAAITLMGSLDHFPPDFLLSIFPSCSSLFFFFFLHPFFFFQYIGVNSFTWRARLSDPLAESSEEATFFRKSLFFLFSGPFSFFFFPK